MSKSAFCLLILTAVAGAVVLFAPLPEASLVAIAKLAFGIFLTLFIGAMVLGRRFKFDPVLR
ncbi:PA3371 family protein [Pseudomonas borbori]